MSVWSFDEILDAIGGSWIVAPASDAAIPMGACIDSRAIEQGQIFFAFAGEQVDGHAYIKDAIAKGASMIVATAPAKIPSDSNIPIALVDDAIDAITRLAALWRSRIAARVVAVTGSNGKTTTCRLIDAVLSELGAGSVSQKSFNNQLGVPITVLGAKPDDVYLVCELGTSSPGEIAARAALCEPEIAAIVSIGRAHLEELGSRAGVLEEKASIASNVPTVIIPSGIAGLEDAVRAHDPGRVLVVSADDAIASPLLGEHNRSNASIACAVGRALGMSDDAIARGLERVVAAPMRFERVEIATQSEPIVVINDAYNANPDSMRASIAVFRSLDTAGRRIAVLGDMGELGASADEEHAALVIELDAMDELDLRVYLGDAFARCAQRGDGREVVAGKDDAAIERIVSMIRPGDSVLLKGSRSMRVERVLSALRSRLGE